MKIQFPNNAYNSINPEMKPESNKDEEQLKQACADFEAILLDSMFQSMRKTLSGDDIFGKSLGRDIYESMYYTQISKDLAKNGNGPGLGEVLYQQLKKNMDAGQKNNPLITQKSMNQLQKYEINSDYSIGNY